MKMVSPKVYKVMSYKVLSSEAYNDNGDIISPERIYDLGYFDLSVLQSEIRKMLCDFNLKSKVLTPYAYSNDNYVLLSTPVNITKGVIYESIEEYVYHQFLQKNHKLDFNEALNYYINNYEKNNDLH